MIEVDLPELKKTILNLNTLIDEFEEIELNLFNQLNNSCLDWQDGNSLKFEDKIYREKKESDLYLQSLKSKKGVIDFIYDKYSELGKKVKCNLNNKNALLRAIENCYDDTNDILNEFNRVDNSFYYSERATIAEMWKKIVQIRKELDEMKTSAARMFAKIENIEIAIKAEIDKLEEIKINDFDVD